MPSSSTLEISSKSYNLVFLIRKRDWVEFKDVYILFSIITDHLKRCFKDLFDDFSQWTSGFLRKWENPCKCTNGWLSFYNCTLTKYYNLPITKQVVTTYNSLIDYVLMWSGVNVIVINPLLTFFLLSFFYYSNRSKLPDSQVFPPPCSPIGYQ